MTLNILTITLLFLAVFGHKCHCWEDILDNISPVSIPPMEDRVFLFTTSSTTESPMKFSYQTVPNAPLQLPSMNDAKIYDSDGVLNGVETVRTEPPEKVLMKTLKVDLKRVVSNLKDNSEVEPNLDLKNDSQISESSNQLPTTENTTLENPKPLPEPPYEADDSRKVTIQLKANPWAFGPAKGKELKWTQITTTPATPKGFFFKAHHGRLSGENGPAEVIQEVNVTNGFVKENSIHAYVRKDIDPVPKPNTHIYIKVVSDGTGKIDPVTIHEPEVVYRNGTKKEAAKFPATTSLQHEQNSSFQSFQNQQAEKRDRSKEDEPLRNLPETNLNVNPNRVKVSDKHDEQVTRYNSYHVQNDSVYNKTHGKEPQNPQLVEIEKVAITPPQNLTLFNVTKPIKYSPQIPVDYRIQTDYEVNPYIPIKHTVHSQYDLNKPIFHETTPSYYSNPDYSGYQSDYNNNPYVFKPVRNPQTNAVTTPNPPTTTSTTTTTTTQTPPDISSERSDPSPPLIPTVPSTGEFIYFNNNPSAGLKENMKVQIIHQSAYSQNKTIGANQRQIEIQGSPTPPTISVPNDPNAKHVYFNIHHEQHIKHDNGKTTLNTSPVYQVNIIPQYPSAPVHVSLKNNERVTVISSDNKITPGSLNISVNSRNGTLVNELDDTEVTEKPITEIKKLVQLSQGQNENNLEFQEKMEEKTPTSVNDILRAIARKGLSIKAAREANRSQNLVAKNEEVVEGKPSTTSKPVRKFTFQTVETTPLVNDTNPTWNNVFEKFQYLARKTLNEDRNRANNSEVIASLRMLSPNVETSKPIRGYLPNKYSGASPLPLIDQNIEENHDQKNTPLPTQANAYVELKVQDSPKRTTTVPEEDMKTFPPGVPKRDWSERMQGQQNKRDLKDKTENPETEKPTTEKPPKANDLFQNIKYETIVENGQIDNINSHSFPYKHITGSRARGQEPVQNIPNNNQQVLSIRNLNRHPSNAHTDQQPNDDKQQNIEPEQRNVNYRDPQALPLPAPTSLYKLPVGQLPDQDPQLAFQSDEFDYNGKRYKIKNGYAYEDIPNYDGVVPQEPDKANIAYEEPVQIEEKIPQNYITENPGNLQLSNVKDISSNTKNSPRNGRIYEHSSQIDQPPVYKDTYFPLPKQKNIPGLTKTEPKFSRAPVKPPKKDTYQNKINHNSFQPRPNYNGGNINNNNNFNNAHNNNKNIYNGGINNNEHNGRNNNNFNGGNKNNNFRPNGPPSNHYFGGDNNNKNINGNQGQGGSSNGLVFNNLGSTINAPGLGNIRIVLVPQHQQTTQIFPNPNGLNGIHIPITVPVPQVMANQLEKHYPQNQRLNNPKGQQNDNIDNNQHFPQQDEDYPIQERYRESTYNQQGVTTQKYPPNNYNQYDQPRQGNQHDQPRQGNQHDQHSQGNQYDQGNQGNQYDQGNQGNQYDQGSKANQYDHSSQGNKYDQGSQGNQYDQGSQGNQYDQGSQGNQYDQGSQGNQYDQPSHGNQYDQPTQANQYDQPSQANQYDQPSQANQYDQPSQANQYHQPSQGNQYDQPRQGNQYHQPGQDYNEQYDQPKQNFNQPTQKAYNQRANEPPPAQKSIFIGNTLQFNQNPQQQQYNPPQEHPEFNQPNHQQSFIPQNNQFNIQHNPQFTAQSKPTFHDMQNQYMNSGAPQPFIPKPPKKGYHQMFEGHNAPYDNSFQPLQQVHQDIPEPKRKPSQNVPEFHLQLPPDYNTDSETNKDPKPDEPNITPIKKERNIYREHRERVTTELYKNDDIPPMPPFPEFTSSMPHFPFHNYEPRRIRKSPPSTTTSTTPPITESTPSPVSPLTTPIRVQVANPNDPRKGQVTLLLYIDPKALLNYNQSRHKKK